MKYIHQLPKRRFDWSLLVEVILLLIVIVIVLFAILPAVSAQQFSGNQATGQIERPANNQAVARFHIETGAHFPANNQAVGPIHP